MWIDQRRGDDASLLSSGLLTDLVVVDAPGEKNYPTAWNLIEDVLFHARRPILVVPTGTKSVDFSRVLIAWNGSQESAKAAECVVDLLPPNAKVTVVQVGDLRVGRTSAEKIVDYLGWHCVETELRRVPARPHAEFEVITEEALRIDAGCIVMGAYTHSRTRELILGGVTDFMLRHTFRPILMAH